MEAEERAAIFRDVMERIRLEIGKEVVGQDDTVLGALTGLAVGGHILLEGAPGLGKTLLVRTLAKSIGLSFSRIQFTPDLMPADVTGTNILSQPDEAGHRDFVFRKGPIFANIILADEINRATPKTQSALLEAMQEHCVTADGRTYTLEEPFLVMATQNPIENEGTYVLPEAQLDRFLLKLIVPPPTISELAAIADRTTGAKGASAQQVATRDEILAMQTVVRDVPIATAVRDYAIMLVAASHPESEHAPAEVTRYVRYGASPRAVQAIILCAKVYALLAGRFNVAKSDIRKAALPALRHRILLNYEAEADGVTTATMVTALIARAESMDKEPIAV
ncbi:MAG TPA: AAA family ATPase [Capsulimonadaceae bacterium]|jgi:MoxR-like ATPase